MLTLNVLFAIFLSLVSGLLNRLRGGWTGNLPFGATTARFIWALGCTLPVLGFVYFLNAFSWYLLALPIALWLGTIMGWMGSLDLARNENTWLRDFCVMTFRGLIWALPTALLFAFVWNAFTAIPLIIAGLLCAVCYEIAWYAPKSWKSPFARGPEVGEVLFGGLIGFALGISLMLI